VIGTITSHPGLSARAKFTARPERSVTEPARGIVTVSEKRALKIIGSPLPQAVRVAERRERASATIGWPCDRRASAARGRERCLLFR